MRITALYSCAMHIPSEIKKIEATLSRRGEGIQSFCKRAGINISTWNRWKAGSHSPNLASWNRVHETLAAKREAA